MEFNKKLQELRKQKRLTQEELAQALYVSRTAVSKWESGRGYPNIDSLKAIANFFSVTVDDLLSGEEILTIAEEDSRQKRIRIHNLVFGLLDASAAMLLFLPFFAGKADGLLQATSLLFLHGAQPYLKILFFTAVIGITLLGILTLAMQNCQILFWQKNKTKISFVFGTAASLLFIISMQPYAAVFTFILLIIKALVLIKQP